MALELLRGPYNIDPGRLYVTYFAGDKVLGIPADLECFEIWRSLGYSVLHNLKASPYIQYSPIAVFPPRESCPSAAPTTSGKWVPPGHVVPAPKST